MIGDANLCSQKWKESNYPHKLIANCLMDTLEQCGLTQKDVGETYLANHTQANGKVASSAIDHIYCSKAMENSVCSNKLKISSTDHVPVTAKVALISHTKKEQYTRNITKRSFKLFNYISWNEALAKQDWSKVEKETDLNEAAKRFSMLIDKALDEVAPIKSFKVKSNYRFGLSEKTKLLMQKRNQVRSEIITASASHKATLQTKFKKLRNLATASLRQDNINFNNKRINEAGNENEIWKVVNDVNKPKSESEWCITTSAGETRDSQTIANVFNEFFVNKIDRLKENIDTNMVEDPLGKLRKKLENKGLQFSIKKINIKTLKESLKKMKKKKSSGFDGLSQEHLVMGSSTLASTLTHLINRSIDLGVVPDHWKIGMVTPVLKKGDPKLVENYRPVTCLPAASKLLESVVCNQVTNFMESNDLLPKNQHGFRAHRSTMTAWSDIQHDWAMNTEDKETTGVLLWDLSAAFDTLDHGILCSKLEIYGFDSRSVCWMKSFLTNRYQMVKIGDFNSSLVSLKSGVPQGGIISPLLYIIYVADLEQWLKYAKAITYADDTSTSLSSRCLARVIDKLETDAINVLKFMASNGLVANPKKTVFMLLNHKNQSNTPISIKIGEVTIQQEHQAKLLGMSINDKQKWSVQIRDPGGLIPTLNKRLFLIRRLKNHLGKSALKKVAESIYISKLTYGTQLLGKIRWNEDDPKSADLGSIQVTFNKLARLISNTKIKDRKESKILFQELGWLSFNQMNAQVKLLEAWKMVTIHNYPNKFEFKTVEPNGQSTRSISNEAVFEPGSSNLGTATLISDAARAWNKTSTTLKNLSSVLVAKKEIKKIVKTLPF